MLLVSDYPAFLTFFPPIFIIANYLTSSASIWWSTLYISFVNRKGVHCSIFSLITIKRERERENSVLNWILYARKNYCFIVIVLSISATVFVISRLDNILLGYNLIRCRINLSPIYYFLYLSMFDHLDLPLSVHSTFQSIECSIKNKDSPTN